MTKDAKWRKARRQVKLDRAFLSGKVQGYAERDPQIVRLQSQLKDLRAQQDDTRREAIDAMAHALKAMADVLVPNRV
mgnify:CR=1 FL=1